MQYPNLFKRIIPFALALTLGLFVASFFVSLTPSFRGKGRNFRQMKEEHRDLKLEVERLRAENDELRKNSSKCDDAEYKKFKLYREWEVTPPVMPQIPAKPRIKKNSDGVGHGYGYDYAPAPPKAVER